MADGMLPEINLGLQERQTQAFLTKATELLYGGGTYGGKSHLMRAAAIIWCAQIPGLQVYLFRREFPDLYKNHMEGPTSFPNLLMPWINTGWARINYGKNYIEFWNGSKIHLCHCQYEKDMYQYDGPEIHVLLVDELTHFTEKIYRYLRGRLRLGGLQLPEQFRGMFPRIVCGTNPGGVGHNWVKASWIDLQPPFDMRRMEPEEGGLLRQFIPALATDNPIGMKADPEYMVNQAGLGDSALVRAKRDGDWNIVAGGAFDDVWSPRVIIPRFAIPANWKVDRSFDWGSTKPFSVIWWAECDGTEIYLPPKRSSKDTGRHIRYPRGSLIAINEWYGAKKPNEGLKMSAPLIAKGIKEREAALLAAKMCGKISPGPADNSIAISDPGTPSIKKQMELQGVIWTESDKSPGSRKNGFDMMRAMIEESAKLNPEQPCFLIMEHCRSLASHIPVLPRDPKDMDDVDSESEDHDYDASRYRVLKNRRTTSQSSLRG